LDYCFHQVRSDLLQGKIPEIAKVRRQQFIRIWKELGV